jgi:hypothetical protein
MKKSKTHKKLLKKEFIKNNVVHNNGSGILVPGLRQFL